MAAVRAAASRLQPRVVCSKQQQGSRNRRPGPANVVSNRSLSRFSEGYSATGLPAQPRLTNQQTDALQLPPQALVLGAAGLAAVAADVFSAASPHLLQPLDTAAHLWVTSVLDPEVRHIVAGRLVSDAGITAGVLGWAGVTVAALHTRHPRLVQALGVAGVIYASGGGSIKSGDPILVDVLKHVFSRHRPSDYHNTFSFPSGHTTAATYICGTLLFLLLPLALQAIDELWQQQPQQEQEHQQPQQGVAQHLAQQQEQAQPPPSTAKRAALWLEEHRWSLWGAAVAVTASGRVLADAHWCSDTMAGACLGVALTSAAVQLNNMVSKQLLADKEQP